MNSSMKFWMILIGKNCPLNKSNEGGNLVSDQGGGLCCMSLDVSRSFMF